MTDFDHCSRLGHRLVHALQFSCGVLRLLQLLRQLGDLVILEFHLNAVRMRTHLVMLFLLFQMQPHVLHVVLGVLYVALEVIKLLFNVILCKAEAFDLTC